MASSWADPPAPEPGSSAFEATAEIPSRTIRSPEEIDDPTRDGWDTESFTEEAMAQWKALGKTLRDPAGLAGADLHRFAAAGFECAGLRPSALATVTEGRGYRVRRGTAPNFPPPTPAAAGNGPVRLRALLLELLAPLQQAAGVDSYFKIYRVTAGPDHVDTEVDVEISGRLPEGSLQINAVWRVRWPGSTAQKSPRLGVIEVLDHEEVEVRTSKQTLFSDCTAAVLGGDPVFRDQIRHGINRWWGRIDITVGFLVFARYGGAIGDADGDGLDDLYVCQPSGLPNRLFVRQADGTMSDRSAAAGVDWLDVTASALFVDFDNDGDQDLAVATIEYVHMMENDGTGRFRPAARLPIGADPQSLCAADYDLDGDVDLYVCMNDDFVLGKQKRSRGTFTHHDATDGAPNHLFRNDGGWVFSDVTGETGLDVHNTRHSLSACWEDFDDDGDPDLYVANDYGPNNLFRNDGGRFVDIAFEAGAEDYGSGMSAHWGDFDRDGRMDVYVANMWSSAGGRVTTQEKFRPQEPPEVRARWRRFAKGNTLLRNLGGGKFAEVTAAAGVEMGRWGWGSIFSDVNNDGWEDLVLGNGYLTMKDEKDL